MKICNNSKTIQITISISGEYNMSGIFDALLSSEGCNVDGTIGNNPIISAIDSMLQSIGGMSDVSMIQTSLYQENDLDGNLTMNENHVIQYDYETNNINEYHHQQTIPFVESSSTAQISTHSNMVQAPFLPSFIPWYHQVPNQFSSTMNTSDSIHTSNYGESFKFDQIDQSIVMGAGLDTNKVDELLTHFRSQQNQEIDSSNSKELYRSSWQNVLNNLEDQEYQHRFQDRENVFLASSDISKDTSSIFEEGMRYFTLGNIPKAMLAFEAIIQLDPENSEGWRMLGSCYNENDEDIRAIQCFKTSLECDNYNLDSLLALGTSYVNESNSIKALDCIKSWIQHNPAFFGLEVPISEYSNGSYMDDVLKLLLAVSELAPNDIEVNTLLGVLYNVSLDFDKAVENFKRALSLSDSNNYSLLNKVNIIV